MSDFYLPFSSPSFDVIHQISCDEEATARFMVDLLEGAGYDVGVLRTDSCTKVVKTTDTRWE